MTDLVTHQPIDPDCRDGKHGACRGEAWNDTLDTYGPCHCHCHTRSTALAEAGVYVLRFPYEKKPIDTNGPRGSVHGHARKVREVRSLAGWLARQAHVPAMDRAQIGLFWYVRTDRRRDSDNLGLVAKAMVDGLVDAGILRDDNDDIVLRHQPKIMRVDAEQHPAAWMELVIAPTDFTWTNDYRSDNR